MAAVPVVAIVIVTVTVTVTITVINPNSKTGHTCGPTAAGLKSELQTPFEKLQVPQQCAVALPWPSGKHENTVGWVTSSPSTHTF